MHDISEKAKKDEKRRLAEEEKDMQRELAEEELEKEKEKLREEAMQKEEADFDKWKDMFQVEEEGNKASQEQDEGNQLSKFIDYVQKQKVMLLEDLGSEFGLSTPEVVSRIKALEETGQLSGVIDDRGKYIYLPEKELQVLSIDYTVGDCELYKEQGTRQQGRTDPGVRPDHQAGGEQEQGGRSGDAGPDGTGAQGGVTGMYSSSVVSSLGAAEDPVSPLHRVAVRVASSQTGQTLQFFLGH